MSLQIRRAKKKMGLVAVVWCAVVWRGSALGWTGWVGSRSVSTAVSLAPRDALVAEYERLATEDGVDLAVVVRLVSRRE